MNKKDLSNIRKEFKLGTYMLPIKEVYSVYLKKDNGEIITKELNYFEMMDIEKEELYLENFKKVLTGSIDSKIFELGFKNKDTQDVLYRALNDKDSINTYADKIVNKISQNYTYDTDVVINFIKAEYYKAKKNKNIEEDRENFVQAYDIILCTVNKVDLPKKALKLDYSDLTFKPNSALDMIINLKSPLDGFMFPSLSNDYVDGDKIIYYSSKAKQLNTIFVEEVLGCKVKSTAAEEKASFNVILNDVIGDKIKPETMQEIYERIIEEYEEQEGEAVISIRSLENILKFCGIENLEAIKSAFEQICGGDYDFKIKNIIPDFYSKSIKLENEYAKIEITPDKLSSMRQIVNEDGKKCLLIELNEDVELNGFKLETEI